MAPRTLRTGVLYDAIASGTACKKAVDLLKVELALPHDSCHPLRLDILPVKLDSLGVIDDASIMPLSYGVSIDHADAFGVRAAYANHYVALHSALQFDTAYAAAIYLSLKTGLIYQGIFNV